MCGFSGYTVASLVKPRGLCLSEREGKSSASWKNVSAQERGRFLPEDVLQYRFQQMSKREKAAARNGSSTDGKQDWDWPSNIIKITPNCLTFPLYFLWHWVAWSLILWNVPVLGISVICSCFLVITCLFNVLMLVFSLSASTPVNYCLARLLLRYFSSACLFLVPIAWSFQVHVAAVGIFIVCASAISYQKCVHVIFPYISCQQIFVWLVF